MYFVNGSLTLLFSLYCLLAEICCCVSTTILRVRSDGAEPVPADGDRRAERHKPSLTSGHLRQ